ncbi:MAG: hypothetical protein JST06_07140 [Bacteroidetes bacterium]|nr:hypothetical protein [Bacteroidota bacterium]
MLVAFLFVLGGVALAVWLLRQASPNAQMKKGRKLVDAGRWAEAIVIFQKQFSGSLEAPTALAEAMLLQANDAAYNEEAYQQILKLRDTLPEGADVAAYDRIASRVGLKIAQAKLFAALNGPDKIEGLKHVLAFAIKQVKDGIETDFKNFIDECKRELAGCYLETGKQLERSKKLAAALQQYEQATNYGSSANLLLRIEICLSKSGRAMTELPIKTTQAADVGTRNDYYYRLALQYANANDFFRSKKVASRITNKQQSQHLVSFLENESKKEIVARIDSFNKDITQLLEGSYNATKIEALYDDLNMLHDELLEEYPEVAAELGELRPAIFNRLLQYTMKARRYSDAFNLINDYTNFWEHPELLKNLAQCSFGIVSAGALTSQNYKELLSAWITATCSDDVILQSLETTSWDDDYTFTLCGSIGTVYERDDIPENVNYNEPDGQNISIGDTQRELIAEFEKLLHSVIKENSLMEVAVEFYTEERDALQKAIPEIATMKEGLFVAAPYFAREHGLAQEVACLLEECYDRFDHNSELLEIAIMYGASENSIAGKYASTKSLLENFVKAIANRQYSSLVNQVAQIKYLNNFESLVQRFESECITAFKKAADRDDDSIPLINGLEAAVKLFPRSEQLKHLLSMYISDVVIGGINAETMNDYDGMLLMIRAFKVQPENNRVASNLVKLIGFNLMDILNEQTRSANEIFRTLDQVKNIASNAFRTAAKELADERESIIDALRAKGADVTWLLMPITSSYINTTPARERLKKVLDIMNELSGGPNQREFISSLLNRM